MKESLRNRLVIIAAIFVVSILFLVFTNLALAKKPLSYPFLLNSETQEKLNEGILWQIKNNPAAVLPEDHFCSIKQEKNKDQILITLHCPSVSISVKKRSNLGLEEIIKNISDNKNLFWKNLSWSDQDIASDLYYFSAYDYELDKVKLEKDTSGLLGRELSVRVDYKNFVHSKSIKELLKALNISENDLSTDASLDKSVLNRVVVFRENRYGFFLPIYPTE